MSDRLITPSQLALFSRSPVIGAWWEEVHATTPDRAPRPDTKALELVQELNCTDLQTEDSSGEPVRSWVIRHGEAGWQPTVDAVATSMINPVVVRRRTDKSADLLDVRLSQLEEHLPELDPQVPLEPRQLPRSEPIRRRQVLTKAGKGGVAVRKLLVLKSGKEEAWLSWPAWLVHYFTDYSPDRMTPLERTLRAARTEVEANAIADALITKNINKGREEVAGLARAKTSSNASAQSTKTTTRSTRKPKSNKTAK